MGLLRLTEDWAVQRALTVRALNMYFLLVFLCCPAVVRGEFWLWQIQRRGVLALTDTKEGVLALEEAPGHRKRALCLRTEKRQYSHSVFSGPALACGPPHGT